MNEENKEPKLHIFGEDIAENKYKQSNPGRGIFGLVVLYVGIGLLLSNFGLFAPEFWQVIFPFWPVLLILLGLKIILGKSRFSSILIFILTLIFLCTITIYGITKLGSPLIIYIPAINNY